MAEFRLSKLADADIAGIANYTIETFGVVQARRYRDDMTECFSTLSKNPMLGRGAEGLAPKLRRYEFRSHVVFYVPEDSGILVVRVLHASMDASRRF
jgi:toxin ParE1/3/4